jgi:agmatine/peptidylarginine deiminase
VRVAAEWEPVTGVVIGWPLRLPRELVCELANEVDLQVMVQDDHARSSAARTFSRWGLDPARIHFVVTEQGSGSYVPRDWGPFAVFDAEGKYRLVDGRFQGYPMSGFAGEHLCWAETLVHHGYHHDDQAPAALARALGVERVELPIALTGGNIAFDGHGTGFATQILLAENKSLGVSQEQFLCVLKQHLGVTRFHFLPNFERLGIQHIDCLLKLLDEERILVKRVPVDHPSYPHVENAVRQLLQLTSVRGRPYQILRIDTPAYCLNRLASYTNSLIVNRKVYVPLFDIDADAAALDTWRRVMPGYEVLGFPYRNWSYTDALHCRVRGVWDPGMLYLSHHRPPCRVSWANLPTLEVQIRDYSGAGLLADRLTLTWRAQGTPSWQVVQLRPGSSVDTFEGNLNGLTPGQTIEYYFSAASASGRQETLPRTAPRAVYAVMVGAPGE